VPITPDLLTQYMNSTLACACSCLNDFADCPCPCRIFISAGPPVWDNEACCSDGQLSIHLDRVFAYDNFPAEQGRVTNCIAPLAGEFVVTLLRCFPGVRDDGSAPTADEIGAASEQSYKDLWVLTNCVICNLASRNKFVQAIFRGSRVLPPQGGCIGVEVRFTMALPDPLPF
jgi:hypothetical protein